MVAPSGSSSVSPAGAFAFNAPLSFTRTCPAPGSGVGRSARRDLADAVTGRGAEAVYELGARLTLTLIGRLARHAATGSGAAFSGAEAGPGEAALMAAVARNRAQAALWAEAAARVAASTSHARAVNLDPGQTIIDTFLDLDATLTRARAVA